MSYELQFLMMVNSDFELDRFVNAIKSTWLDINWVRHSSFDMQGNWIQISANDEFDPDSVDDPNDGFLHYRYRLEISPMDEVKDVQRQVDLAITLKERFVDLGCAAEICADFEELLPND